MLKFGQNFAADIWLRLSWLYLGPDSEARFVQDHEVKV